MCGYTRDVNDLKIGVAILTTQLIAIWCSIFATGTLSLWQNFVTNMISQTGHDSYHI